MVVFERPDGELPDLEPAASVMTKAQIAELRAWLAARRTAQC